MFSDGGYGVTVNTRVCGALDSGSIPDSRPKIIKDAQRLQILFCGRLSGIESERRGTRQRAGRREQGREEK